MIGLISVPGGMDDTDVDYASDNILDSYRLSWKQNQVTFSNQALSNLSAYSTDNSNPVEDVEQAAANVTLDGEYEGTEISNYTFDNWEVRSQELSSVSPVFSVSSELSNISVSIENLTVAVNTDMATTFRRGQKDIVSNDTFEIFYGVRGVQDPYLASRGYDAEFNKCSFNSPVSNSITVSPGDYNGTGYGEAAVMPSNTLSQPIESVLVTSDVSNYSDSYTQEFAAVVTNQSTISSTSNSVYASNVNITSIADQNSLIVHEGEVYPSRFREIIRQSCYIAVEGYPGIEERFSNETQTYAGSVATFINETEITASNSSSSVGYDYFNGASNLREVAGVTFGRGEALPWFRVSQDLGEDLGLVNLME